MQSLGFCLALHIFTPFISFLVLTELPHIFVLIAFPIRSICHSLHSVDISMVGSFFAAFAALFFPLRLAVLPSHLLHAL